MLRPAELVMLLLVEEDIKMIRSCRSEVMEDAAQGKMGPETGADDCYVGEVW